MAAFPSEGTFASRFRTLPPAGLWHQRRVVPLSVTTSLLSAHATIGLRLFQEPAQPPSLHVALAVVLDNGSHPIEQIVTTDPKGRVDTSPSPERIF